MSNNFLSTLGRSFTLAAAGPPASEADIEALRAVAEVPVPSDYVQLVGDVTDAEFLVLGISHVRIWGPARAREMNEAYSIQRHLPRSLAVGDDEGGRVLILMSGAQGPGLYLVGLGELEAEEARYVAASLSDFLVKEIGVDLLR